jgi:thiol-disulfide isomerase/thioredoxin
VNLIFFHAPWCSSCHAIRDRVPDYCQHVDCATDEETAIKYNVQNLPLFIAVDENSNEVARISTTNMKALEHWFEAVKIEAAA